MHSDSLKTFLFQTALIKRLVVFWLLFSLGLSQAFAMQMMQPEMGAAGSHGCMMVQMDDAMSGMVAIDNSSTMPLCADMTADHQQDCSNDHCVAGSAILTDTFEIVLPMHTPAQASADTFADSVPAYPPFQPPRSH